jgi:hypothetical protein
VSDLAAANAGSNKVSIILSPFPKASIGDATVMEGQSGTISANFVVTLSIASSQQITLPYSLNKYSPPLFLVFDPERVAFNACKRFSSLY